MFSMFQKNDEKKVEYLELIYDLIFVYLIGRNNALIEIERGFFTGGTFLAYILSTLVILQIWYFSTLLINRYGSNSAGDYIALLINMYLLYYLADGIHVAWSVHYARYNGAWGLILLNLAVQYGLHLRKCRTPWETRHLKVHMALLLVQAVIVLAAIPLYIATGVPLAWICLLFGFAAGFFTVRTDSLMPLNFEHLSERVMLFVVFTFGELIVGIAEYFDDAFSLRTAYFSLMGFLITVGLFVSYGFLYNRVVDREKNNSGTGYMLVHIGLITALNCLTVALGYMRDPDIREAAKNVFLVASFLAYYIFMFFIGFYARGGCRAGWRFFAALLAVSAVFAVLMLLTYRNALVSIAVSVLFVYAVFGMIVLRWRQVTRALSPESAADRL